MSSNVGSRNIYEDGDQKNYAAGEAPQAERFHEGKPNSHLALDSSMSSRQIPTATYDTNASTTRG